MNERRLLRFIAIALAGVLLPACGMPANLPQSLANVTVVESYSLQPPAATVYIVYNSFTPPVVTIKAGQVVQWVSYTGSDTNSVTFKVFNATISSPPLYKSTWSYKFQFPGTFNYFDNFHNSATGKVVVQPN